MDGDKRCYVLGTLTQARHAGLEYSQTHLWVLSQLGITQLACDACRHKYRLQGHLQVQLL
jgi:hypothetical protein